MTAFAFAFGRVGQAAGFGCTLMAIHWNILLFEEFEAREAAARQLATDPSLIRLNLRLGPPTGGMPAALHPSCFRSSFKYTAMDTIASGFGRVALPLPSVRRI